MRWSCSAPHLSSGHERRTVAVEVVSFKLSRGLILAFGHFPCHEIAGKWPPDESSIAAAQEAEQICDVYASTTCHPFPDGAFLPLLNLQRVDS
jgi:hypothetical protein